MSFAARRRGEQWSCGTRRWSGAERSSWRPGSLSSACAPCAGARWERAAPRAAAPELLLVLQRHRNPWVLTPAWVKGSTEITEPFDLLQSLWLCLDGEGGRKCCTDGTCPAPAVVSPLFARESDTLLGNSATEECCFMFAIRYPVASYKLTLFMLFNVSAQEAREVKLVQLLLHWSPLSFLWLQTGENLGGNKRWRNPWSRRKKRCFQLVNWLSHGRRNLGLGNSPLQRHIYLCQQRWNSQDLGPVGQSEYCDQKSVWSKMNILSKHPFSSCAFEQLWNESRVLPLAWAGFGLVWPIGLEGLTSTAAHGVSLVGHCLLWWRSAGWGIKEAF